MDVTKDRRAKAIKPVATREEVYVFAHVAIDKGYPEVGAAAVICFEWLQRPENVLAGFIRWTDYRGAPRRQPFASPIIKRALSCFIRLRIGMGHSFMLMRR